MKTLIPNLKNHVLKILCSLLLLLVMIPGALAQEFVSQENHEQSKPGTQSGTPQNPDDQSKIMPGLRLNVVNSDAMINGLIVGRGQGANLLNVALGYNAVVSNTSGAFNTGVGSWALQLNSSGGSNTALGSESLRYNTSGDANIAVGGLALGANTSGNNNTALGFLALRRNSTGNGNTALGGQGLYNNTTGLSNIAIGVRALYNNTVQSNLVAVGDSALYWNGEGAIDIQGSANTAVGSKAAFSNTKGYSLTAVGWEALHSNTAGSWNTGVGVWALNANTTGTSNTAVGVGALADVTTTRGNTAIGVNAGRNHPLITDGTFLGSYSYPASSGLTNITGIGYNSRPTKSNQLVLGNSSVKEILYYGNLASGSDSRYKKNIEEGVVGLDFLLKLRPVTYNMDVHKMALLLKEDMEIGQFGEKMTKTPDEATLKARDQKSSIYYSGFIAQEVEAAAREVGYDFSGVIAPVSDHEYYSLDYISFTVPIVKAIQEQQAQIEALSPEGFDALREELSELRQANEELMAAEASLRAENEVLSQRQSLLEAENESISGQVKDILSMLETLGMDIQDCCKQQSNGRNPGTNSLNQMPDNPRLEQNTPNPFHENTLIRYFLPEGTQRAQILITDMAGTQVMALPLEHQGAGQVLIHGGTLPSGTYVYTLTVDGRKVDSKRMVLL